MNTPAHLILAAAVFARPYERRRTLAALAGALAPDLSLYLLSGTSIFLLGLSPHYVFGTLYFSETWQQVFAVDNSFVIWGVAFAIAWWSGATSGMVFAASGLLHLAFDFPLHHDDARPHFWPVTDWVFRSPISYWDSSRFAGVVGPVETVLSLLLCASLMLRFTSLRSRLLIGLLAVAQLSPLFIWAIMFASDAV